VDICSGCLETSPTQDPCAQHVTLLTQALRAYSMFLEWMPRTPVLQGGEDKPVSDQWLPPFVIVDDDDKPVGPIEDGDSVRPTRPGCWQKRMPPTRLKVLCDGNCCAAKGSHTIMLSSHYAVPLPALLCPAG